VSECVCVCVEGEEEEEGGGHLKVDGALSCEIRLVACKSNDDVGIGLALQLFDPRLCTSKRVCACHIVNHNRSLCTPVVHWRKAVIPFLQCNVTRPRTSTRVSDQASMHENGVCRDGRYQRTRGENIRA
jgi:hypothetical protein